MTSELSFRQNQRDDFRVYDPVAADFVSAIRLQSDHWTALHNGDTVTVAFATETTGIADPLGGTSAIRITDDSNTVYHVCRLGWLKGNGDFNGYPGEKAAGQHAWRFSIKAGTSTLVDVVHDHQTTAGTYYVDRFNLATGAHVTDSGSGVIFITPTLADGGASGWWDIYTVGKKYQNPVQGTLRVWLCTVNAIGVGWNGGSGYTGASNRTFDVWGWQAENGQAAVGARSQSAFNGANQSFWGINPGLEQMQVDLPTALSTPTAMTIYARYIERGNAIMANATQQQRDSGILRIGDMSRSANNAFEITQTATGFTATLNNNGVTSTSSVAVSPVYGDAIELRATVTAAGATLHCAINGGSVTSGSSGAAAGLPVAWNEGLVTINGCGDALWGDMDLLALKIFIGDVAMDDARE